MSQLIKLTLDKFGQIDYGRAQEAFMVCLKQAVRDCYDRPGVKNKRKVSMVMTLSPVPEINGNTIDCASIAGTFYAKASIPNYETQELNFGFNRNGELIFNPDSPGNVHQQTFIDDEDDAVTVDESYQRGVKTP
jgi:hypothetical protein